MNKLTKAAIAGGAGIILLLGGGGTFAVWNASSNAGQATITAGSLSIVPNATSGTWSSATGGAITDITNFRIVPGDVLTYTAAFDVTAVGDNLTASVALAPGAITPATTGDTDKNDALAARLTNSASFKINNADVTTLTASAGVQTVTVSVSITWEDNAADNAAMTGAVNLANFGVTLTQTI
ncbi:MULTISPECIES: alternate-type signal peptide domain-containing protein [unclassified Cryobacterium]|uniref:alternate-type signal peptide domain-containing protein n=1 Tax=unclassified Cryobacterium TaxID=2649013 RepID=UPI001444FBDC|nr:MULTISPECIES: alternate-type signal peptide domain-containing protein [unclassified Cryobacterium]